MRIAQIAPPWITLPPKNYGGTESVISNLVEELVAQGHNVTLFAPGDTTTSAKLVSFFPTSLLREKVEWSMHLKAFYHLQKALEQVRTHKFDIVHTHLSSSSDMYLFPLTAPLAIPHVTTLHSKSPFDRGSSGRFGDADRYYMDWASCVPLVAISKSARDQEKLPLHFIDVVYNGIDMSQFPPPGKKRDDYLKNHVNILPQKNIDDLIRKNQDAFDYTILGHQLNVNEFGIVDRCEVCHLGTREPLVIKASDMAPGGPGKKPDDLANAFVSHPRKELLQIHNPERFGCSACHGGNGRATTSVEKGHGRNPFWLHPLFHKENTEAGCQMCHANDRVTQGADTLNLAKDLFYQRGCVGCHRMESFDRETDALTNARQQITQIEEQIGANQRQAAGDLDASGKAADDTEVRRLLAHAESLRVQNSQLAARIDELNLQTRYLQQDQKKVAPNLKDVRLKLRKDWIPLWLKDPQAFRPGTKMPTFWRFSVDEDGDDDLKAVTAYLWQNSFDGKVPVQTQGDKTHGKGLFESRGCLACHSVGEEEARIGGTFAANLSKVGEKANYDYIVRWIYNPRERYAPYCPKEHRDLTPEDYAKHGKPFRFDTELNSTCPNDGAELQVQNMTVMPNLRLSEQDARDVATYLFSLSAPPSAGLCHSRPSH